MKSFISLVTTLLLAGCTTVGTYRPAKIQDAGDGAVIVRLLPNMDGGVPYFERNGGWVTVARVPGAPGEHESKFRLSPSLDATSHTAVYAGALPPGTYRFVEFPSPEY